MRIEKGLTKHSSPSCTGWNWGPTCKKTAGLQGSLPYLLPWARSSGQARGPEAASGMHVSGTAGEYCISFPRMLSGHRTCIRGILWAAMFVKES